MRVLHFSKFAFERPGGIERHVELLTKGLASTGIDVTVMSYSESDNCLFSQSDNGICFSRIRPLFYFGSQPVSFQMLIRARQLSSIKPFDIIHEHWPDPLANLSAHFIPGHPIRVMSWHSDIIRQKWLGYAYRRLARFLPQPQAVITATRSHSQSTQLAEFVPQQHRHIIPFGVDLEIFSATEKTLASAATIRKKYGGRPIIFSLGRHVYYKGFEVLIDAMSQVPGVLILGGEGPLTESLRTRSSYLGSRVVFTGEIADQDLPAYFHACDVFCLPSVEKAETFGFVQAEAMACGKPVVNTWLDNGVNELAVHDVTALTVKPASVEELSRALNKVLSDSTLAERLGRAGRSRVKKDFTVNVMVRKTIDLYEHLICQRKEL